ncbi:small oligopeptide transporter, OPT family protein [Marssonina coronariae]|uniref:Small oligopeptide transporter, OPT family protein n=1 Tax=Diplocarpon coronariae TaxID=2795749 RepID=A0A218ZAS7_9HELO|nr:small oligopeptide transporter, OPT family protein [Marssonina coronariae]
MKGYEGLGIKPKNVALNQLFGGFTGLSLIPITFDWTYVLAYLGDLLLAPVLAFVNALGGLVIFVIISVIGISCTGAFYSDYLPVKHLSDLRQHTVLLQCVQNPHRRPLLEPDCSQSLQPLIPGSSLNYVLPFAALMAVVVHKALFYGNDISYRFKAARIQEPHVPTCMILATRNITLSLNVISPFLAGYMILGKPVGVIKLKVFSTICLGQASFPARALHEPPQNIFSCQLVASIWACFVQVAVMNWTLGSIDGNPERPFHLPERQRILLIYSTAQSCITIGVIGPKRMFGPDSTYRAIQFYLLLGALLPMPFYFLGRFFPRSPLRVLSAPVMLGAMAWLPPYAFLRPLSASLRFPSLLPLPTNHRTIIGNELTNPQRNPPLLRPLGWWHHYNYIAAAGLDASLEISTIVIILAITFPEFSVPQR